MSNLNFVVQQHTTPSGIHWDLMLEQDDTLWTWRLDNSPEQIGDCSVSAEHIADHPLRFLNYEGPVQNATGQVKISDKGILIWQSVTQSHLICQLDGDILKGLYSLTLKDEPNWVFKLEA